MAYNPQYDPFEGNEKVPSLSWRDLPPNSTFTLEVLEPAKKLQSTNFDTGKPDFWDEDKTQPKWAAVINVLVLEGPHSVGEQRSIWAQIPSNMFITIKEAQKAADAKIDTGGVLHLKFTGTIPHKDKKMNPIKQYVAKYVPPKPTSPDAFDEEFPEAPARPQPPARPATPPRTAAPSPATATTGKPRW